MPPRVWGLPDIGLVVVVVPLASWQWPLTQAQPAMSDPKSKFSTRVEVFTRATADAFNPAIGEVLDARNPWQLLYRLSRIVFLGLVLYLGWILVVVQSDLARRLILPNAPMFQQRYSLHRKLLQVVLRATATTP
ncbi:MAG: hypothetical protein ACK535_06985 [Cyanobacteriota bacterium]